MSFYKSMIYAQVIFESFRDPAISSLGLTPNMNGL